MVSYNGSLHLNVSSYPPKIRFGETGKIVIVTKQFNLNSYKVFLSFNFLSLSIKNWTGCIHTFNSLCIVKKLRNLYNSTIAQNALGHGTIYMYLYPTLSTYLHQPSFMSHTTKYIRFPRVIQRKCNYRWWRKYCSRLTLVSLLVLFHNFFTSRKKNYLSLNRTSAESGHEVIYISRRVEWKWNYWRWLKYCSWLTFGSLLVLLRHLYLTSQTSLVISLLLRLTLAESCHELNQICRRVGRKL